MNNEIPLLQLKNWHIHRGQEIDLGPLDFSIYGGEIVTVMGPSGVGKTTWLMSILGYEEVGLEVSGERLQYGHSLLPGRVPKQALYIPQAMPFNPNWEVQAFLSRLPWGQPTLLDQLFPLRKQRLAPVKTVLQQLGLSHRAKATLAELSGGEAQRAAVAQLFLMNPQLFVADEFVSGLDPGMSTLILEQCRRNLQQSNGSAILALHDVQSALKSSDRILIVWPPSIDHLFWELQSGKHSWTSALLYTLLCLARWTKDLPFSSAIKSFIAQLGEWIKDEQRLHKILAQFSGRQQLQVMPDGELRPLNDEVLEIAPVQTGFNPWIDIAPIRIESNNCVKIGVAISPNPLHQPIEIIAGNEIS